MNQEVILDIVGSALTLHNGSWPLHWLLPWWWALVISIFQATTQIQEQTLDLCSQDLSVFLVLILAGSFMINTLIQLYQQNFQLYFQYCRIGGISVKFQFGTDSRIFLILMRVLAFLAVTPLFKSQRDSQPFKEIGFAIALAIRDVCHGAL
jgi:flagellar biosynthetic protein FliQ